MVLEILPERPEGLGLPALRREQHPSLFQIDLDLLETTALALDPSVQMGLVLEKVEVPPPLLGRSVRRTPVRPAFRTCEPSALPEVQVEAR
jgi:hypothetical protein